MGKYKKVDTKKYVEKGIKNGTLIPIQAEKVAKIAAKRGKLGEKVISWSVDREGKPVKEKIDYITNDSKTNKPGWIITKVDENGKIIIDNNGNSNQWIMKDSLFQKKYILDTETKGLYKPIGETQEFVQIKENLTLFQWGENMNIASGGYINITNPNKMYGIAKRDFDDTYHKINKEKDK